MTTDSYINENKTATFKKGENVVMHTCGEADYYKGKVWECQTDSYNDRGGQEVVFLTGFSGCFSTKFLQKVQNIEDIMFINTLSNLNLKSMNKPEILGVEVLTPDGRGSILSLHTNRVIVHLNKIEHNQVMKGNRREEMHYAYEYKDVEIIRGQYCFNDERIKFQYEHLI